MGNYLITGATGLIASDLVKKYLSEDCHKIFVMTRSKNSLHNIYTNSEIEKLTIIETDLLQRINKNIFQKLDCIFHLASPTDSNFFITNPVETIDAIIVGTKNILELARELNSKVLYFSSNEVYGLSTPNKPLLPNEIGFIDPLYVRSCYPQAKRAAENLCVSYSDEYGVDVRIVRLGIVVSDRIRKNDFRAINQFMTKAICGEDIVLETGGETILPFISIKDTLSAIDFIYKFGKTSVAYNVSNPFINASIKEIADIISQNVFNGKIKVICLKKYNSNKYLPIRKFQLNVDELLSLGWRPKDSIEDILRLIALNSKNAIA